jgi:hypothetical protein
VLNKTCSIQAKFSQQCGALQTLAGCWITQQPPFDPASLDNIPQSATSSLFAVLQMGLSTQHMQLASYLPAELVEAYASMGMTHDLYQWQVRLHY